MARVFVHHNGAGKILSVASVRVMSDELPHPFQLDGAADGVLEASPDDPACAAGLEQMQGTYRVDIATGTLIRAERGPRVATKKAAGKKPAASKPRRPKTPSR